MKYLVVSTLLIGLLASCGSKEESGTDTQAPSSMKFSDMKIAYYVTDSVATNFEFVKEKQEELQKRFEAYQGDLLKLQEEGQRMMGNYQQKLAAGLLSQNQQVALEQQIKQKEHQIQVLQQTDGMTLEQDNLDFQNEFLEKLETYAKEYCQENGFSMLFSKEKAGGLLYADGGMDATMDFIAYMNKQEESNSADEDDTEENEE